MRSGALAIGLVLLLGSSEAASSTSTPTYRSAVPSGNRPVMLIFHPGAFVFGSASQMGAARAAARNEGFKPIAVEYENLRGGLRQSKHLARRYEHYGHPVYAYGESAGGTFAGVLAKRGFARAAALYDPPTNLMHQRWAGFIPPRLRRRVSLDRGPTKSPILAIASKRDAVVGSKDTRRWARRDPHVRLALEPGGHLDQADYPQALRRSMRYLARRARK